MDLYDEDLLLRLKSQGFGEHIESMKIWHNRKLSNPKQKTTTIEFQLRGNKQYADGEYRLALISYNKALCYAEKGSEDIGVLFSNRSAVAFAMKFYSECLKNIQLARDNNFPKNNLLKLKTREEKCLKMISNKKTLLKDPENLINLLYGSINDTFMIDCLEIVHKKNENPYLVTKRNLNAGDVIASVKPFVGVLTEHSLNLNCINCLKECILDLIPCDNCAFVMFCSEKCKNSKFQIHQYECGIIDNLISVFGWKILVEHNHYRTLFKALSLFDGSVEDLMKFVNEINKSSRELLTLDICNNEKSYLKAIYSLNNDFDDDVIAEYCYSFYPKIKEMMVDQDFKKFVFRFTKKIPRAIKTITLTGTEINGGFNPLEVVLSLSCAPNVFSLILNDSRFIYSVQHPIKAGEKLTIGNNCHFPIEDKKRRQEKIFKTFEIKCDCVACVKNYPLIHQLKIISRRSFSAAVSSMEIARSITGIGAYNMFKDNMKFIDKNFDKFPCQEIAMIMVTNTSLLSKALCSTTN